MLLLCCHQLDSDDEHRFDNLSSLVSSVLGTPGSAVILVQNLFCFLCLGIVRTSKLLIPFPSEGQGTVLPMVSR